MDVRSLGISLIYIVPAGSPDWITAELIEATIRTWQPYYRDVITPEVAVEMIRSVGQLYQGHVYQTPIVTMRFRRKFARVLRRITACRVQSHRHPR